MGDREPRRDRPDRQFGSTLGKRGPFDQGAGRGANGGLHFRMLVQLKKAGSVIGKGGDFIQMTKSMTGAKVGVDKPVGQSDERLVHIEGADEPGKPIAGIQEALLRTAERIMGEEGSGGQVKLPHKCQLRMLLFKYQIGAVMGKKGVTINEIRNKSGASVKLTTPQGSGAIVPCAEQDDELITIVGTPEATLTALKLISDKLRAVVSHGQDRAADRPDNKRSRPDDRRPDPVGPPGQRWDAPGPLPPGHPGLAMPPPGAPPPGNAIAMALPPAARGVLANNDSVKTEGLAGPFTVEYKVLVPVRKSGVILGGKGGVIKEIRSRTGAKVHFFDEEKGAQERILQVMSTEDVQDQHCAAFDAAMDFVHALVQDEKEPTASVRIILPHGQVGAIMGKAGSTIKELRNVSGCQIQLIGQPDVPKCLRKGEEVLELRGPRDSVLLATHIALVAIRGNMARGQLIYNYPPPAGAPPPTLRGPPPMGAPPPHLGGPGPGAPPPGYGAPPPGYGAPPPGAPPLGAPPVAVLPPYAGGPPPDPRLQPPQPGAPAMHSAPPPVPRGRSRWDSDAPPAGQHVPPQQLSGPPPVYAESQAPVPQYAPAPPQQQVPPQQLQPAQTAAPPQQPQQVQYVQGPPPSAGVQVVYSSAPPPAGYVPAPQQQVVYTGPDGQTYVQQQPAPQQQQQQQAPLPQQQPVQVAQQQAPAPTSQPMLVYTSPDGQTQYMQQHPPQQVVQQQQPQQQPAAAAAPAQPPVTYVYAPASAAAPSAATAVASTSGPASASGYGGLTGLVTAAAPAPVAAAPPPAPKARVLLTQDQVVRLRLEDKNQCVQLGALSGAVITLSDHVLENGAREVLLAGNDAQCNTAKNLMEALMRSG